MIVTCEKCQTGYKLDASRVKAKGSRVRCTECQYVFRIYPPKPSGEAIREMPQNPPPPPSPPNPGGTAASPPLPPSGAVPLQIPKMPPPPPPPPSPPPEPDSAEEDLFASDPFSMSPTELESLKDRGFPGVRKKTVSFRTKLIYLTAALVGCVGIIFISAQFYRPIEKLYERIHITKLLLEELSATLDPVELDRMNRFALDTIRGIGDVLPAYDKNRDYFFLSFNMLLSEGKILPKQKLVQMAKQGEIGGFENHFDYESLDETQYYWQMRFAEDPGIFRIFQKYKSILIKAKEEAGNSLDFSIADVYIMIDSGTQNGFFQDHIAFVLDGYRWSESPSYCGEPYEAGTGNLRDLALEGQEGSDHSLIADLDHWYLPGFVKNEWGSWFGVWQTRRTQDVYNTFTVYFDASYVKKQMQSLVITVVCGIAFLLIILAVLYRRTSRGAASENY